jgi:hypothetical protein
MNSKTSKPLSHNTLETIYFANICKNMEKNALFIPEGYRLLLSHFDVKLGLQHISLILFVNC